ncbi:hypothetical protein T484DRAFT_2126765 [Baffinella frigidus]|nr:hypothetical protein T484DRAFT_2126765 [Cryptophyta sp. CCMP2293]
MRSAAKTSARHSTPSSKRATRSIRPRPSSTQSWTRGKWRCPREKLTPSTPASSLSTSRPLGTCQHGRSPQGSARTNGERCTTLSVKSSTHARTRSQGRGGCARSWLTSTLKMRNSSSRVS